MDEFNVRFRKEEVIKPEEAIEELTGKRVHIASKTLKINLNKNPF